MTRRTMARLDVALFVAGSALAAPTAWAAPPVWALLGPVAEGGQFDAVRGPDDRIHLIARRYYQLDGDGAVLVDEDQGDDWQGVLHFPPAIAVADDGTAHIITRHGGTLDEGHDIRYRSRSTSGSWDRDYLVGTPVARNYVVSIAWAADHVYLTYSEKLPVAAHSDVHLWEAGPTAASFLGRLSDITRSDDHTRMRGHAGRIYLVTGRPNDTGNGGAFFLNALAGDGLRAALEASSQFFNAGAEAERKGFPDLYLDGTGTLHFTYGAQETVYYQRLSAEGQVNGDVVTLATALGSYNMSVGLSAVAASDDGSIVVAVLLSPPGIEVSGQAADSALLSTYSLDGGQSWSVPAELGPHTDAGTGRHLPRLVAIGTTFYLFYEDHAAAGVSLATTTVSPDHDGDGFTTPEDCDDADDQVFPGANEQCNSHDDNCDGEVDEGCAGSGGAGGGAGGAAGGPASPPDPAASDESGSCSCRAGSSSRSSRWPLCVALALVPLARRRALSSRRPGSQ